jgi:hypothetical protein
MMLDFLLATLGPLLVLWALAFLTVIYFRQRLPFCEAEIVDTYLGTFKNLSGRCRFVVRFRLLRPGIRTNTGMAVFVLAGQPDRARESSRYAELKAYYSAGRRMKAHYLPHCEWLFGYLLETPGRPPQAIPLVLIAAFIAVMLGILYLRSA